MKGEKRKTLENEIHNLKRRKQQLEKDVTFLSIEADTTADSAEQTGDLSLLSKSNAIRRRAKEKSAEVHDVERDIKMITSFVFKNSSNK